MAPVRVWVKEEEPEAVRALRASNREERLPADLAVGDGLQARQDHQEDRSGLA